MGARAGKRERPRANMDHARSLDGSRASPLAVSATSPRRSLSFLRFIGEKNAIIPCVCHHIWMLFIYLDLRDSWRSLLSPLRLPVPPSRLAAILPDGGRSNPTVIWREGVASKTVGRTNRPS